MIKDLLFKFILVFYRKDYKILKIFNYHNSTQKRIHYMFNNKKYIFIGEMSEYPPEISKGFSVPIKSVKAGNKDVTEHVKMCSGPKNDFYKKIPDVPKILGRVRIRPNIQFKSGRMHVMFEPVVIESRTNTMEVTNLFNQTVVLGKT